MTEARLNREWPASYALRVDGHIDAQWGEWFAGLTISIEEDGTTLLSGLVLDQSALHGLLRRVGDLGMTLISVNVIE